MRTITPQLGIRPHLRLAAWILLNTLLPMLLPLLPEERGCFAAAASHCDAVDDVSVRHFDVRLPIISVPEDAVTTYVCQVIEVPVSIDKDYHAVAFQPLIDNHDVMHHMILFSCDGSGIPKEMEQPHACGRGDNLCRTWMAQWSMGVEGVICPHNKTGVRFGKSVGRHLLLQTHWNNQQLQPNMTDSSGMRVFYTSDLRPYDLGHVQVGQQEVVIPPGVNRHAQSGGCSADCTRRAFAEPIYITQAHLHMHYLGSGGWLDIVHSDGNVTQVFHDDSFDFNHPAVHTLQSPVPVYPGDDMRVTCLFSSRDGEQERTRTIFFGEGSDGEMCYVFMEYYPQIRGFDQCIQLGDHDMNCDSDSNAEFHECTGHFMSLMTSQFIPDVIAACNKSKDDVCYDGCKQSLDAVQGQQCLQGALGGYVERQLLPSVAGWDKFVKHRDDFAILCGSKSVM